MTRDSSAPYPIRITTFGTLQVERDGETVTESDWHTRQARQLLKILITERPQPVATDRLIDLLWPDSAPNAAATTLRSAINALRNVLEPDRKKRAPSKYIHTQSPGYAYRTHPDVWLDVEEFEQLLNQAANASSNQPASPSVHASRITHHATSKELLTQAIALYHDDYLAADPYADWAAAERERLRERYFSARLALADEQAASGDYRAAIESARAVLARDPVRENAYQSLMRFQAQSGDSAAALMTYERARQILADELGADPSPLTQQWHARILNGEVEATSHQFSVASNQPSASNYQPTPNTQLPITNYQLPTVTLLPLLDERALGLFVGRDDESARVQQSLDAALAGSGQIFILDGEAGVGKTRLAYHILQQAGDADATVLSAACQALEQELPFAPLADALSRYLHALPENALRGLPAASLIQLSQIVPSLRDRLPALPTPQRDDVLGADDNRQRLIDGIVAFLTTVTEASSAPLALFIDDLQWADGDTLAVLSRLSQAGKGAANFCAARLPQRGAGRERRFGDAALRALKRSGRCDALTVQRFTASGVQQFITHLTGQDAEQSGGFVQFLYEKTQGNALFVTETLRDLQERQQSEDEVDEEASGSAGHNLTEVDITEIGLSENARLGAVARLRDMLRRIVNRWSRGERPPLSLRRNQRVQEIIIERIERLPDEALDVLQLAAVIGRDFSLDLLESASAGGAGVNDGEEGDLGDPLDGLETLLRRKFLLERPDERLDFSHRVVHQVAYDSLSLLQRRRLHRRVAEALVALGRAEDNPREAAMHFGQAGTRTQESFARYSVLAGEALLQTFGFRQAIEHFDDALAVLDVTGEANPDEQGELAARALAGRGRAYESMLDPDGLTDTYRRLHDLALRRNDRALMLTAYSRLAATLQLAGQERESHEMLQSLFAMIQSAQEGATHSAVVQDLLARRHTIFHALDEADDATWSPFTPPPTAIDEPLTDLLQLFDPVHAVMPLLSYAWVLRVQGQTEAARECLDAVVEMATRTRQPLAAGVAYHQLATLARMQGDADASRRLNEQSIALNRQVQGVAAEVASLWPRIASAYSISLRDGQLERAERQLQRVLDFLAGRDAFRNHRNSATIGLGLVAFARGDLDEAESRLNEALADPVHLYPYTHVRAMLGLADVAHARADIAKRDHLLRQALRFAGERSLLEEYAEVVATVARHAPTDAPVDELVAQTQRHAETAGLSTVVAALGAERVAA